MFWSSSNSTGGPDVIRKEAWPCYRTISGVRLCWELEEPKGTKAGGELSKLGRRQQPKREGASLHHIVDVEASSQGWVVDVPLNRKGGGLHCTSKTLGQPYSGCWGAHP